jgi:hypothetical protein
LCVRAPTALLVLALVAWVRAALLVDLVLRHTSFNSSLLCRPFHGLSLPHSCKHCSLCLHTSHTSIPRLLLLVLNNLCWQLLSFWHRSQPL